MDRHRRLVHQLDVGDQRDPGAGGGGRIRRARGARQRLGRTGIGRVERLRQNDIPRPGWPRVSDVRRRAEITRLPAMAVVTKQTRDRAAAAKKMDLKAVGLFFGARFRIDAPDVLLRIGISSLFHHFHSR